MTIATTASKLALASVFCTMSGGALVAQTAFEGTNTATDRNDDLLESVQDDIDRDVDRVGNSGRTLGWSNSVALRATASSGNSDTADLGIGADFVYFDGVNGYSLELNYDYSEDSGTTNENSMFYDFEYTRDFNPALFGFAKVQGTVDEFSAFDTDTFVGFGVGYRVYDTPDLRWSVQGGPGYRFTELTSVSLNDFDEPAIALASNLYYKMTETTFLTNDTDIIYSDEDTVVLNDFGVTVSISNTLAMRTSLLTEYHTDPQPGFTDTDNSLGVSLVYSF